MFTIRREHIAAFERDAARRARAEWLSSLRAQGFIATEDASSGQIVVEDPAGGRVTVEALADGFSLVTAEAGPKTEKRSYRFRYNADKQLSEITDPGGLAVSFGYDERRRLSTISRGAFGRFTFLYDTADNLAGIQYPDAQNALYRMHYDDSGRLIQTVDRNGSSRQFEYSSGGLPFRVIGPKGEITQYEYGPDGQLNGLISPTGDRHAFEDDAIGHATVVRVNERQVLNVTADDKNGAREFRYIDGSTVRIEFMENRIASITEGGCTVKLSYDGAGRLLTEETILADGSRRKIQFERNALGYIEALTTPANESIRFKRDSEQRLRQIVEAAGKTWEVDYALSGALASIRYPNGVVVARDTDALGLPRSQSVKSSNGAPVVPETRWDYDGCDRVVSEALDGGHQRRFQYDAEGRLVKVENDTTHAVEESWELDPNGNRERDRGGRCSYNRLDQLMRAGGAEFRYDLLGNMTEGVSPQGPISCKYDSRGRLRETSVGGKVTRYTYDPLGRRLSKEEPGCITRYTWAGQWLLAEEEEPTKGPKTRRDYVVVPDWGVPVAQRVSGWYYQIHFGRRFEPLAMTNGGGRLVWRATYDAFGSARVETAHVPLAIRLPGQYFDRETGLHYNLARYYDPRLGRYLQRDPLGYEAGSWNEYIYCGGDPFNRADPTGEFVWILAGAAIGALVGGGIEAYRQHKANPNAPLDWGKIGKEALIGGAVGALGAAVAVALAPAVAALGASVTAAGGGAVALGGVAAGGGGVIGGASAAVETCANSLFHGQVPTAAEVLKSAGIGFGVGAATAGVGAIWANRARRAAMAARELEEAERRLQHGAREAEEAERRAATRAVNERPCTDGCPVDSLAGEVVEWKTDFVLPGALPLTLKRSHSSGLNHSSCFGPRWASTWGQSVEVNSDRATYCGEDGRLLRFDLPKQGDEKWVANPEAAKFFLRRTDTAFELRDPSRCLFRFRTRSANRWLLGEIEDPNGYKIRFTYDNAGALRVVEHSGGYRLAVEGTSTQIRRVTLLPENGEPIELMRYEYDSRGRLAAVIDGSGQPFRYWYNEENRLTRWEDRKGTFNEYHYDGRGRVVRTSGPDRIYYCEFEYDEQNRTNRVTDSLGNVKTYVYNELMLPVLQTDARGGTTRTVWDRRSNKLEEFDAEGRGVRQQFDANGNLLVVRDALERTTRIAYNALDLPDTLRDAAGHVWRRFYDERGNLTEACGPDGAVWRYQRDEKGNPAGITDPAGYERKFGYDPRGLLEWATDAKGNQLRLTRDALGRVIERIDALGRRTQFGYNALGKLAEAVLPDGACVQWHYDLEGNLERRIRPDGKAYTYRHGPFDLLQEVVKPSGGKLKLTYDTEARLIAVKNELQQVWSYEYNATGQVVRERDFHGRVQQFDYDGSGLCLRRVNGLGQEILLDRDLAGQLVSQRGADETRYEYDALGRVRLAVRGGVEVALDRDAYGRVLRERQGSHVVESSYDSRGLRVKRSLAAGHCEWVWDANGELTELKLPGDELLEFVRDAGGRELERKTRVGLIVRQGYDPVDRLAKQWVGIADGAGKQGALVEREFRYDLNGDPIEIRDNSWGASRFTYDLDGRIESAQRERGRSEEFKYDLAGNIAAAREVLSQAAGLRAQAKVGMTTRFYGKNGRLERVGETRYEWDADGRLKEKREGGSRWRYGWTADGRLESVQGPNGQRWRYEYDAFGRRVAKIGPARATTYVWDGLVVACEIAEGGSAVEWFYEPESFRPLVKREGGETYQCITDQMGAPRELLASDGKLVWSAGFSTWGAVDVREAKEDCPIRFQGQWFDSESSLHYNFHRYYDKEIGQYLSPDPTGLEGGLRPYGYVHNPLSWIDPTGLEGCPGGNAAKSEDETLSRLGTSRESASRLGKKASEAEEKIGIHGVSVSADTPTGPASQAPRPAVEAEFPVHNTPTRNDPLHRTVELPKPVTPETAEKFNRIFGRK